MNKKKIEREMISFGLQSKKKRQEMINSATMIISVLNNANTDKKIDEKKLSRITAGENCGGSWSGS